MPESRLLVCLVTRGYPHVLSITRAQDVARRAQAAFSTAVADPLYLGRELAARQCRQSGCTHLLAVDETIVPPEDVVERLLALDRPVAAAVYPQWHDSRIVTNVVGLRSEGWLAAPPDGPLPVKRCRLGCALIRRDALERVPEPWFLHFDRDAAEGVSDDAWFCRRVREGGLQIFCDGRVRCRAFHGPIDLLAFAGWSGS